MQDVTFRKLNFYNNYINSFLTCAGHNFIIDGQEGGKIYIWNRTKSLSVKNCNNVDITLQGGGKENIIGHGVYKVFNNIFTKGNVASNLSKNNTVIEGLGGLVYNSILGSLGINKYGIPGSIYKNCTINPASNFLGYISNITMIDCNFNPNKIFITSYSFTLNNCSNNTRYFENSNISIDTLRLKDGDVTLFENCNFNYKNNNFIYVGPNAYDTGFFNTVKFNNCTITLIDQCNKSFIYCNAKPNGNFIFENCSISIPANITILDAYNSNKDKITNLILTFNNSPLPDNIKLISNYLSDNLNIKFNIF